MAAPFCGVSIFSDVRDSFKYFENEKKHHFIVNLPFYVLPVSFFLILFLVINLHSLPTHPDINVNILILTAAAVNIVIITSIGLLYKEIIIKIEDSSAIKDMLCCLMEKMGKAKEIYEPFVDYSIVELQKIIDYPNQGIRSLHNKLYCTELLLIFASSAWAFLSFLIGASCVLGFIFCGVLIFYMIAHGIVLVKQHFLRKSIVDCIDESKISIAWERFQKEVKDYEPDNISKGIEKIKKQI